MHINDMGEGSPAVAMDSGLGTTSILYATVLPEAAQLAIGSRPEVYEAAARETEVAAESFAQARASRGAFGDLPLMVLTGAEWWTKGRQTPMKKVMLVLREELAVLSSRGQHIVVEKSSHTIPADRPDGVTEAIRQVVEIVRQQQQRVG